jgi:hypothetical protein
MRLRWVFLGVLVIVAFAAFVALGGECVKLLWNWLMPAIFGLPPIRFWQALGLLALARIFFGGFGFRRGGGGGHRAQVHAEMRERMRQRIRERFGFGPAAGENKTP